MNNLTPSIISKLDRRLFANSAHPIGIIKELIWSYFDKFKDSKGGGFKFYDNFDPIVSTEQNFDALCFPLDHVGRSRSDSYFINSNTLLRTHMTANEPAYIKSGDRAFLIAGDVYRRDEIDSTHYPVFHQLEGVRIFDDKDIIRANDTESPFNIHYGLKYDYEVQQGQDKQALRCVTDDLYVKLTGLMKFLFGDATPIRWQTCFFPFTSPSFEIEVKYRDRWVEVCGSGVLKHKILSDCGAPVNGWAFGLGLERLAMILFDIPDIRIFWSEDERFLNQFQSGKISKFVPFSKYPFTIRDMSFWLIGSDFDSNSLFDLIRQKAGDLVEDVKQVIKLFLFYFILLLICVNNRLIRLLIQKEGLVNVIGSLTEPLIVL